MQSGTSETRLGASPSSPLGTMNFAPGTVLPGRYRIVASLAWAHWSTSL